MMAKPRTEAQMRRHLAKVYPDLDPQAVDAYVVEHLAKCHCGQTREWHGLNQSDHHFEPEG